jgi:hypothetical protein
LGEQRTDPQERIAPGFGKGGRGKLFWAKVQERQGHPHCLRHRQCLFGPLSL